MPSVAICVPSGNMVHADFALSLATMTHGLGDYSIGLISAKSANVADARNMGVDFAFQVNADFLFFIDSDMTFPRNALHRLISRNLDVVGATYSRRTPPFHTLGEPSQTQPSHAPPGLLLMNRLPGGFMLLKLSIFGHLKKPFFRFVPDEISQSNIGEDYNFCDRMRNAGIEIWCDQELTLELGHIGQHIFASHF